MTNKTIHRAESRGHANHGWLDSHHTFSFANYHDPERMNFGVLRVLNDDQVAPGKGFGKHPHANMEIISIPLEGDLKHEDSMGNKGVIKEGDVQVMSAGTGIEHSEYNKNNDRPVKFLQIWLFPNKKDVAPRYDQMTFNAEDRRNKMQQILSPNPDDDGVWIHQNAWFHLAKFDPEHKGTYTLKDKNNGVYIFLLEGKLHIDGEDLKQRDGIGLWNIEEVEIAAEETSEFLLMEVPMQIG